MTTHTPLARYSAANGALVSGFATAELHHLMGHDLSFALGTTRKWKSWSTAALVRMPYRCRPAAKGPARAFIPSVTWP